MNLDSRSPWRVSHMNAHDGLVVTAAGVGSPGLNSSWYANRSSDHSSPPQGWSLSRRGKRNGSKCRHDHTAATQGRIRSSGVARARHCPFPCSPGGTNHSVGGSLVYSQTYSCVDHGSRRRGRCTEVSARVSSHRPVPTLPQRPVLPLQRPSAPRST